MGFLELVRGIARFAYDAAREVVGSRVIWLLLSADLAFLILHMSVTGFSLMDTAPHSANWARIDRDNSFSELFECALLFMSAVILIWMTTRSGRMNMIPIAFILLIIAVDNMLGMHETLARLLIPGHQNYGELLYFVLLLAFCLFLTYLAAGTANGVERTQIAAIWLGILVLSGFGVGVDAVHAKLVSWEILWADRWMGLFEDLGELVSISLISAMCLSFARKELRSRGAIIGTPWGDVARTDALSAD